MKKKKRPFGVQYYIKKHNYEDKTRHAGKEIIPVGINFSSTKKSIDEWLSK